MMTDTTGFYGDVQDAGRLPRRVRSDRRVVEHGYAAEIGGMGTSTWFFFGHLEPALVFGRAARQSGRITSYGVHPAAEEWRWDSPAGPERKILHVVRSERLDRRGDEREHITRWADRCDPCSAHWPPTPGACEGGHQ